MYGKSTFMNCLMVSSSHLTHMSNLMVIVVLLACRKHSNTVVSKPHNDVLQPRRDFSKADRLGFASGLRPASTQRFCLFRSHRDLKLGFTPFNPAYLLLLVL